MQAGTRTGLSGAKVHAHNHHFLLPLLPLDLGTGRAAFRSLRFNLLLDGRVILKLSGTGSSQPSLNAPRSGELTASWASPLVVAQY